MARHNNGPRLKLNPRGVWEIRWTDNGRSYRRSTGTDDRNEAEQVFAGWLQVKGQPQKGGDLTVTQAITRYYEGHVLTSCIDVARKEQMHGHLIEGLGAKRVLELDDRDFQGYIKKRRAGIIGTRPVKDPTIRQELSGLRSALNYCAKQRDMGLARADVPTITLPDKSLARDVWLTEDQVDVLLKWLEKKDQGKRMSRVHRFIVLALATTARRRAIENLKWEHVETHTGLIRYDKQVKKQTKKRKVAVPVADWLQPYLDRMAREAETIWVLDKPTSIVCSFEYAMLHVSKATGDKQYLNVDRHALRHTAATLMLRAGASLWQVAGVLGDSPETVAHTYGHHCQDHIREAANSWRKAG